MDDIIEYYKLCGMVPKSEQLLPLVNHIEKDIIAVIFTNKQVHGFLEEKDGVYHLRETVIGAGDDSSVRSGNGTIMVFS